jgi:HAMP domain-containing protein
MFELIAALAVGVMLGAGLLMAVAVWSERPWR